MNYYERHLGDYARDTAHLSLLEHGAYTILLDRFYATEQGIPADQAHRIARAKSRDEKAAVDAVLAEFFTLENGAYVQKRGLAEIERAQTRIKAARENGKTGGRPRANPKQTHREPTGFISETQTKALQTPDSNLQTPISSSLPSVVHSEASDSDWNAHHDWVLSDLRAVYPSNQGTDAEWMHVARVVAGMIHSCKTSRADLLRLTTDFAAQVDAKGNRNTQFVTGPLKHFGPTNLWRGPFPLPAAQQRQREETPMERLHRLNSPNMAIEGEVING